MNIKKLKSVLLIVFSLVIITSCGKQEVISDNAEETKVINNATIIDGEYKANLTMEGGTGKAYILSPVDLTIKDGKASAKLVWSSKNYDYMIVDDVKYLNESEPSEASSFTVIINDISEPVTVIADTVAMSQPHEIEYVLYFDMEPIE